MDCINIFSSCEKPETTWELVQKIFVNAAFWGCTTAFLIICVSYIYINIQPETQTDYMGLNIKGDETVIPPTIVFIKSSNSKTEVDTRPNSYQIDSSTNLKAKSNSNADCNKSVTSEDVNSKHLEIPKSKDKIKSDVKANSFQ